MAFSKSRLAKVYAICNINDEYDENSYIGSTTQRITTRMHTHKDYYKKGKDKKLYNYIREHGGWESFDYTILGVKIVNSQSEQFEYEQEWIDSWEPTLNERRAHITPEQTTIKNKAYREANKEYLKAKNKEYYEKNYDKIAKKNKKYHQENKEKIGAYHKDWAKENKAHLKEYKKKYYQANKAKSAAQWKERYAKDKEKIKAKQKIPWTCECGAVVQKVAKYRHLKTDKHKRLMEAKLHLQKHHYILFF
jgi:hypothetical protein